MKYLFLILLCFTSYAGFSQIDLTVSVNNTKTLKPVTGINVLLVNNEIGYKSELPTNAQGKVVFKALSIAGSYTVNIADNSNYFGSTVENIQFRSNENPSVDLVVTEKKTGDLSQVTVYGGSSKINTVNAEVSAQLKRKELEDLPIEGRDITRSLYRLPNVTQATGFYPEAPNVSINGSNSLFNSYLIDGMDNNERFLGDRNLPFPWALPKT